MTKKCLLVYIIALTVTAILPLSAADAETTLKAYSALPKQVTFTQQFLKFIKKVNNDKNLGVKIKFIGGPGVIPPKQEARAVQHGVIDISYTPANYLNSQVPEGEVLAAATVSPSEARKNGGMALLNSIYEKKLNSYLLGWFGAADNMFHIYTVNRPEFKNNGEFGQKLQLRSTPYYRYIIRGMGATGVDIDASDVYTALQRGTVDGVAWPILGLMQLSWNDYLKYRIDPGFFRMNTIVLVNLDSWNRLSKEQKHKLQALANQFETTSRKNFKKQNIDVAAELDKKGMKKIQLKGAALKRYQRLVNKTPWKLFNRYGGSHEKELKEHFLR